MTIYRHVLPQCSSKNTLPGVIPSYPITRVCLREKDVPMYCIMCSSGTKVTNSRPHKKAPSIWRRRACLSCAAVFTTWESVQDNEYAFTVQTGHHYAPFSLPRLLVSIYAALSHRKGHKKADDAYWLAVTVAQQVKASATNTVTAAALAKITYEAVRNFDTVAGLTYGTRHEQC